MSDRRKILITGASGNIGDKLRRYLEERPGYDLTLIDKDPKGDGSVIPADLCRYDEKWVRHFDGIDTVLHLAADGRFLAPWEALERPNVDAVINVYEASAIKRVRRVIFASSMHTVGGERGQAAVTTDAPSCPGNFYGATKVVGERLGKSYAERHNLSVICLRIGWVQAGENRPGSHMGDSWAQKLWLSNRDLCAGFEKAIAAENIPFAVLNLTSQIDDGRWSLSQTQRVLGFVPQDKFTPMALPWDARFRQLLRRGKQRLSRMMG